MAEVEQRVAKNTLVFTIALVIQKIFSFTYFALLARFLGAADVGRYAFAISFTTIFTIFIDFGLTPVLTRAIARQEERWETVFFNVVSLKVFLAAIIYGLVLLAVRLLGYDPLIFKMVAISGVVMMLDSFTLTFWGVFRGKHNLKFESVANVAVQAIMVGLGLVVLFTSQNLLLIVGALLVASAFHFVYALVLLVRKAKVRPRFVLDRLILKATFLAAIPFGLAAIFNRVYSYIDTVFLTKMHGADALGYYSVSYKLILALQFIPMAFSASIYPAMSAYFNKDHAVLARIFERSTHYLLVISLPISLGAFAIGDRLILGIYGSEYMVSVRALEILILALIFLFANFPVGAYLNATHRQKTNTVNQGIAMVASVGLNFWLVPQWSFLGSATAFLASTILLWALGTFHVVRTIRLDYHYLLGRFARTLLSAVVMAMGVYYLKPDFHLVSVLFLAAAMYVVMIFGFKAVSTQELRQLARSFRKS